MGTVLSVFMSSCDDFVPFSGKKGVGEDQTRFQNVSFFTVYSYLGEKYFLIIVFHLDSLIFLLYNRDRQGLVKRSGFSYVVIN